MLIKTFYFVLGYSWLPNNVVIVSGEQLRDSALHEQVSIVPKIPHPSRLAHTIEQSFTIQLYYTVGPCWLSILNIAVCTQSVSSVAQLCLTLCNPMACSMPGFPLPHQLLELTQTHVHRVSDAIQLSHPLSSPSPPAFNLSQCQGLF